MSSIVGDIYINPFDHGLFGIHRPGSNRKEVIAPLYRISRAQLTLSDRIIAPLHKLDKCPEEKEEIGRDWPTAWRKWLPY